MRDLLDTVILLAENYGTTGDGMERLNGRSADYLRAPWCAMCPGCCAWQVEYAAPATDDRTEAEAAAAEHRAECPGLDMLAGLAGIPA